MNKWFLLLPLLLVTGCTHQLTQLLEDENITCLDICQAQPHPTSNGFTWNITGEVPTCNCAYYFSETGEKGVVEVESQTSDLNTEDFLLIAAGGSTNEVKVTIMSASDEPIESGFVSITLNSIETKTLQTPNGTLKVPIAAETFYPTFNGLQPGEDLTFTLNSSLTLPGDYTIKIRLPGNRQQTGTCKITEETMEEMIIEDLSIIAANCGTEETTITIMNTGVSTINSGAYTIKLENIETTTLQTPNGALEVPTVAETFYSEVESLSPNSVTQITINPTLITTGDYTVTVKTPNNTEETTICTID